jgi:hypothetical protein
MKEYHAGTDYLQCFKLLVESDKFQITSVIKEALGKRKM